MEVERAKIEVVLNEYFEYDNKKYRCILNLLGNCSKCDLKDREICHRMNCANHLRADHLPVMFVEEAHAPDIPSLVEDLKKATAKYLEWAGKPVR